MATLDQPCDRCGGTAVAAPGQAVVGGRLAWSVSIRCAGCGAAEEVCGWDEPPAEVRAAIVALDGVTRLSADAGATSQRRVAVLAVLRRDGRSLAEAADAYDRLTTVGLTGTAAEMRLLADRLAAAGAVQVSSSEICH